jgi:hypothetical protein
MKLMIIPGMSSRGPALKKQNAGFTQPISNKKQRKYLDFSKRMYSSDGAFFPVNYALI